MNGNRGAKGSVNDRIISFLFRKRYFEYLKKKESYTKEERQRALDYLKRLKTLNIDKDTDVLDIDDRKILNEALKDLKINSVNPNSGEIKSIEKRATEIENSNNITLNDFPELVNMSDQLANFSIDGGLLNIDDYELEQAIIATTSLGELTDEEIIDLDLEIDKRNDEVIIYEELEEFITEGQELLDEIKTEISLIRLYIDEQYTMEDIKKLDDRYQQIKKKIDLLKKQYDIVKENYEFEGYEELDKITLIDTIEDYKTKATLDELEKMVDSCKEEFESLNSIAEQKNNSDELNNDLENKKRSIKKRDDDFIGTKKSVINVEITEELIKEEAIKQQEILKELQQKINLVERSVVQTTEYVYHYGRMFSSFLRVAAGILTAPFSRTNFFGVMLGTHLINRGVRDLRSSLIPDEIERTEIREKYKSVEYEILHTKDEIETTFKILDDSLEQIDKLKCEFRNKFEPYSLYIPEYGKVKNMIDDLDSKLHKQKEKMQAMKNTVEKQYTENKQKILKMENK